MRRRRGRVKAAVATRVRAPHHHRARAAPTSPVRIQPKVERPGVTCPRGSWPLGPASTPHSAASAPAAPPLVHTAPDNARLRPIVLGGAGAGLRVTPPPPRALQGRACGLPSWGGTKARAYLPGPRNRPRGEPRRVRPGARGGTLGWDREREVPAHGLCEAATPGEPRAAPVLSPGPCSAGC